MTRKEDKLTESSFSLNLGTERRQRLFEKSLKEGAKRKRTVTLGELVREAIDKDLS